MKRFVSLAVVVVAAALPFVTGCAEDEYEVRDPAYPEPIGYTTPPSQPPAQAAAAEMGASPAPVPLEAPAGSDPSQLAPGSSPQDVVVGDGDAPAAGDQYADADPSALTDFRSTLEPYGTWMDDPTYGTVWVPSPSVVGADFTPYVTAGHWDYDDDYTWVSDYDWGWAPFHYGRWVWVGGAGWEWIPGRTYAGAWVSWRYGWDDWAYVGWAPLGPTWCWHGGRAVGLGFVPAAPYAFVGTGELFAPSIGSRVVTGSQVGVIAAHTRPYVPASPGVNGRVAATPGVGGPSPATLHIPASAIAHGATTNRGVVQARAFAHPSSAVAMGARAPQTYASPRVAGGAMGGAAMGRAPAYGPPAPSHFGGKLGAGFRGSIGSAAPSYGYRPPAYTLGSRPYSGVAPRYSTPAASGFPAYRGPYGGGGFRGAPGLAGHAPVAPSGGSRHTGEYSEGVSGGFHGGGFRGGYHGGGGGGFHGGGGGGGGHSGGGRR